MNEIILQIDGKHVAAPEGATILEAARSVGIAIPTVCDHAQLSPYGACRICTVEADSNGRTNLVASCQYPVEKDMVVRTKTEKVDKIRKVLLEQMLAHAPDSEQLWPWPRSMARTGTVLKRSLRSAFSAVSA